MTSSLHFQRSKNNAPLSQNGGDDETVVYGIPHAHAIETKDAESRFDELLDMAQENPTAITGQGGPVAVVLSVEEYECLRRLNDFYQAACVTEGKINSSKINVEEAEDFFRKLLDAPLKS